MADRTTVDRMRTPLDRMRTTVELLFPWVKRIGLTASGALGIRSVASRIEIEGGGPAVARVGDVAGRILFDPGVPMVMGAGLYYSPNATAPYVPVAQVQVPGSTSGGTVATLPGNTPGTPIVIATGSGKVTCS